MRQVYGVPSYRGGVVEVDGRIGTILSSNGSHLRVRFSDGRVGYVHPTWRIIYTISDSAKVPVGFDGGDQ